jgi:transposase
LRRLLGIAPAESKESAEPETVAEPSPTGRPWVPQVARSALMALAVQLDNLTTEVRNIERQLLAWHRQNAASQQLETIPGVGLLTATALAASVPDPTVFKSGRQFAAYLGLVPRQNSSGGKDRLGHISKMGNRYLRRLLVVGATSVTRRAPTTDTRTGACPPGRLCQSARGRVTLSGREARAAIPARARQARSAASGSWVAWIRIREMSSMSLASEVTLA